MPDITILPLLADYFKVSTDQLLGLKPLDGETYIPEKTATKDFWNQKFECCGLYIDGMDYQELCRHEGLEKSGRLNSQCRGVIMRLPSELHI